MMHRFLFLVSLTILFGIPCSAGERQTSLPPDATVVQETTCSNIQDHDQPQSPESSKSSVYLQFNTSGLFPSLRDWKNQLHLSDGTHPTGTNIVFGGEVGWVINSSIQAAIGYEFFFTTKVSTLEAAGDQINSTFFYGSVRGSMPLESIQDLSLFGSIDVGTLSATEVMENYRGLDFNKIGSTTAYRLFAGAQYFMIDHWSIMAGAGYFWGNVKTVSVYGQPWPNFGLDLSGPVIRFAVNYHFPL